MLTLIISFLIARLMLRVGLLKFFFFNEANKKNKQAGKVSGLPSSHVNSGFRSIVCLPVKI